MKNLPIPGFNKTQSFFDFKTASGQKLRFGVEANQLFIEIDEEKTFITDSNKNIVANLTSSSISPDLVSTSALLVPTKTPVNAIAAQGTITVSDTPVADETMEINGITYTFVASRSAANEITLSADNAIQVTNIIAAVTLDDSDVLTTDGAGDTVLVTSVTKGVIGNAITLTSSATGIAVDGSGTLGTTTLGIDGTVGVANEVAIDASYLYYCLAVNTIADNNWRRISLGSAY